MKIFVFFISLLLGGASVHAQNLAQKVREKVSLPSKTLEMVLEIEQPNPYQKTQIRELAAKSVRAARAHKFASMEELVFFLNAQFPTEKEDTPLMKWAFAENAEQQPKGALDCDARALLVIACMEMMGNPFGKAWPAAFPGHVVLSDGSKYYDLIEDKRMEYDSEQLIWLQELKTPAQVRSLIWGSMGSAALLEGGKGSAFQAADERLAKLAKTYYENSLREDPDNLTTLYNIKHVVKHSLKKVENAKRRMFVLTANYLMRLFSLPRTAASVQEEEIIQAMKRYPSVTNEVIDLIDDARSVDDYKTAYQWSKYMVSAGRNPLGMYDLECAMNLFALNRFEEMNSYLLSVAKTIGRAAGLKNTDSFTLKSLLFIAHSSQGNVLRNRPEEMSENTWNDIVPSLLRKADVGANMWLVGEIMTGRIPPVRSELEAMNGGNFSYAVLNRILEGRKISFAYMDPVEKLMAWPGCREFMEKIESPVSDMCK